jgi:hypothetical protein
MTPIEMHYSWIGFVYQAMAWLGQRLAEKWFDVVLALHPLTPSSQNSAAISQPRWMAS